MPQRVDERSAIILSMESADHRSRTNLEQVLLNTQEETYNKYGLTTGKIVENMPALAAAQAVIEGGADSFSHLNSLYLDSSDSLSAVDQAIYVEGQRVLTVAGSGDFAQGFIKNGARDVTIFDMSFPACFWQELKLAAAKILPHESYCKLFSNVRAGSDQREPVPLLDGGEFLKMKAALTPQAQLFFSQLLRDDVFKLSDMDRYFQRFYRRRDRAQVDFFTTDKAVYEELQRNLKTATYQIVPSEISGLISNWGRPPDIAYLSNIGYSALQSHDLADIFLQAGVGRVVCTWAPNTFAHELNLELVSALKDASGRVVARSDLSFDNHRKMLSGGGVEDVNLLRPKSSSVDGHVTGLPDIKFHDDAVLAEGLCFTLNGLDVKVLAYDPRRSYGLTVELRLPSMETDAQL